MWIEAAEQVRSRIESDQDIDFFEEETRTDAGDSMYERMRRKNKTMMINKSQYDEQNKNRDGRSYDCEDDGDHRHVKHSHGVVGGGDSFGADAADGADAAG